MINVVVGYAIVICVFSLGILLFVAGFSCESEVQEKGNVKRGSELAFVSCFGLFLSAATLHFLCYFRALSGALVDLLWAGVVIGYGFSAIVLITALMLRFDKPKPQQPRPPFGSLR
jgi:hypothetical protein